MYVDLNLYSHVGINYSTHNYKVVTKIKHIFKYTYIISDISIDQEHIFTSHMFISTINM
jgi:hypothetical protein